MKEHQITQIDNEIKGITARQEHTLTGSIENKPDKQRRQVSISRLCITEQKKTGNTNNTKRYTQSNKKQKKST